MRTRKYRIQSERHRRNMAEYLTDDLLADIMEADSPDCFLENVADVPHDLSGYLLEMLAVKGLKKADVIRAAQLNETFGYQIFSGQRGASRNKVLALALAMGLDLHQTHLLLMHADVGDLYSKNRRDAIVIFCINNGYGLSRTDEELYRRGEETISDADAK